MISNEGPPDPVYEKLEQTFSRGDIVAPSLAIVAINGWNRPARSMRAPVGAYVSQHRRMAFALVLGENKTPPERVAVSAACTFDEVEGAPRITTVELTVRAQVPGLEAALLEQMVGRAADLCPVSNPLRGNVEISVRSELASSVEATPKPRKGAS